MRVRDPSPSLSVLHPHAAGINVHSDMHMVCVPPGNVEQVPAEPVGLPSRSFK